MSQIGFVLGDQMEVTVTKFREKQYDTTKSILKTKAKVHIAPITVRDLSIRDLMTQQVSIWTN
jgi:hypothetical protein